MDRTKWIRASSRLLRIFLGCFWGCFLGICLFRYLDYRARPELYLFYSAPWYTGLLPLFGMMAGITLLCLLAIWALKHWGGETKHG